MDVWTSQLQPLRLYHRLASDNTACGLRAGVYGYVMPLGEALALSDRPCPDCFSPRRAAPVSGPPFGVRLRRLRMQRGLTLRLLGDLAGVCHTSVCRWERGDREKMPGLPVLLRLAEVLRVSVVELLDEPGECPVCGQRRDTRRPAR